MVGCKATYFAGLLVQTERDGQGTGLASRCFTDATQKDTVVCENDPDPGQ
jgi:hypothetical protein